MKIVESWNPVSSLVVTCVSRHLQSLVITCVLRHLQFLKGGESVLFSIDNMTVCAPSREDHLHNLRAVFKRLSDAGLRLNRKCVFDVAELTFFGHVVSAK